MKKIKERKKSMKVNKFIKNAGTIALAVLTGVTMMPTSLVGAADNVQANVATFESNVDTSGIDFSTGRLIVATDDASLLENNDAVISSYNNVYLLQYDTEEAARDAYAELYGRADIVEADSSVKIATEAAEEPAAANEGEETAEAEETTAAEETAEAEETVAAADAAEIEKEVKVEQYKATVVSADEEEAADETLVNASDIMTDTENPLSELNDLLNQNKKAKAFDIALIDTGASDVKEAVSVIGDDASDDNGHGSLMRDYILGINDGANILSVKALDADGRGTASAVYAAIQYAVERDVDIINLSFSALASENNSIVEQAINEAIDKGIIVVGAAGNNGQDAKYYIPGNIGNAIIVGAADAGGNRLSISNYGDTVDYNVIAGTTSEAAAKMSGWISANSLDKISDVLNNGLIYETDYEGEAVADADSPIDVMVKYLFVDKNVIDKNDTIDDVYAKYPTAVIMQTEEYVKVSEDGENYVFYADAPYAEGSVTSVPQDAVFAEANDRGHVLTDGMSFDRITKKAIVEKSKVPAASDFGDLQLQVMIPATLGDAEDFIISAERNPIADTIPSSVAVYVDHDFSNDAINKIWKLHGLVYDATSNANSSPIFRATTGKIVNDNGEADALGLSIPQTLSESGDFIFKDADGNEINGTGIRSGYNPYICCRCQHVGIDRSYFVGSSPWSVTIDAKLISKGKGYVIMAFQTEETQYNNDAEGWAQSSGFVAKIGILESDDTTIRVKKVVKEENPSLTINKEVDGTVTGTVPAFDFEVTYTPKDAIEETTKTFKITAGTPKTISCSPGTKYTVTELDKDGWALKSSTKETAVETKYPNKKTISGEFSEVTKKNFDIEITYKKNGEEKTQIISLSDGELSDPIEFPDGGKLTVIERKTQFNYPARWTVESKIGKKADFEETNKQEITVDADKTYRFIFRNTYHTPSHYLTFTNERSTGYLALNKKAASNCTDGNELYSLENAKYAVYATQAQANAAKGADQDLAANKVTSDSRLATFITDKNGKGYLMNANGARGSETTLELDAGTYYIAETASSMGYELDGTVYTANVTANNTENKPVTVTSKESPVYDPLNWTINKYPMVNGEIADDVENIKPISGAVFKLEHFPNLNYEGQADYTWYFETDENGQIITNKDHIADENTYVPSSTHEKQDGNNVWPYIYNRELLVLPQGSIKITEVYAPEGLIKTDSVLLAKSEYDEVLGKTKFKFEESQDIIITNDNLTDSYNIKIGDAQKYGKFTWTKQDDETGKYTQGLSSFDGITFEVKNAGDNAVIFEDGNSYEAGAVIGRYTLKNKEDSITLEGVPLGTYEVTEAEANSSYLLNPDWKLTVDMKDSGGDDLEAHYFIDDECQDISSENLTKETEESNVVVKDEIVRGDVFFQKVDEDGKLRPNTPFLLVSYDSDGKAVEAHVIVTDSMGIASTAYTYESVKEDNTVEITAKERKHSENTNRMDSYVKKNADGSYSVTEEGEQYLASGEASTWGVWFSQGLDPQANKIIKGAKADPIDERGALYYGKYQLFEIQCKENKDLGEDLLVSEIFTIKNKTTEIDPATGEIISEASKNAGKDALKYVNEFVDLEVQIDSKAKDVQTQTQVTFADADVVLSDTISFTNVKSTSTYKWVIDFVETGNMSNVLSEVTVDNFKPEDTNIAVNTTNQPEYAFTITTDGTIAPVTEYDDAAHPGYQGTPDVSTTNARINTENLRGKSISAIVYLYEYIKGYDFDSDDDYKEFTALNFIKSHNTNMNVESEIVYVPDMNTEAIDIFTKDHVGTKYKIDEARQDYDAISESDAIIDTVSMTNLGPKEKYMLVEVLMDKDTGERFDQREMTYSFYSDRPEDSHVPEWEVVMEPFTVDSGTFAAKTLVVYEELWRVNDAGEKIDDIPVVTHERRVNTKDFTDEHQMVHYIDIDTTATDTRTTDHVGEVTQASGETTTIIDNVALENLIPGMEYTIKGEYVFTKDCTDANGVQHKAGDPVKLEAGSEAEVTFTAEQANEIHDITYVIDSSMLEGITLVSTEYVYHNGILIDEHVDLTDEDQCIHYPKVRTSAVDDDTLDDVGTVKENASITDTVELWNLIPGMTYTITGRLMEQETGNEYVQDGIVMTPCTFVAEKEHEFHEITFTGIDATKLADRSLVVFENLFHRGERGTEDVDVARHNDISDKAQTIHYPDIHTTAVDSRTGDHAGSIFGRLINSIREFLGEEVLDEDMAQIVDTVTLTNLVPGRTYTISGILMNKDTGESIKVDGEEITQKAVITVGEGTITAENNEKTTVTDYNKELNRVDGTVDLTFTFDSSVLIDYNTEDEAPVVLVAFEKLIHNDVVVNSHEDITDEEQSVYDVALHTTAIDDATGDHVGDSPRASSTHETVADEVESHLTDTVHLSGLVKDYEYELVGYLAVKEESTADKPVYMTPDGKLTENKEEAITSSKTFTATGYTMDVDIPFTVAAEEATGYTFVVFETLFHEGPNGDNVMISAHADITDEAQSIHYPKIETADFDVNTNDIVGKVGITTITDIVTYTNLMEDEDYTVTGKLVYQEDVLDEEGNILHKAGDTVQNPGELIKEAYTTYVCDCGEEFDTAEEWEAHAAEKHVSYICECGEEFASQEELDEHIAEAGEGHSAQTATTTAYTEVEHEAEYGPAEDITAEAELKAGEHPANGTVELTFDVNSAGLAGLTTVAFEDLWHNGVKVACHADILDEPQTIHFPDIHTNAIDFDTQDEVGSIYGELINSLRDLFGGENENKLQTIVDTVSLDNLVPGMTYTVTGVLMNKETGEPILINDETITQEAEITVGEGTIEAANGENTTVSYFNKDTRTVNGTVDLTYKLDSSVLIDYGTDDEHPATIVVFETLWHNGIDVNKHCDLDDEAQTIYDVAIHTMATDIKTEDHVGDTPRAETTFIDTNTEFGEDWTVEDDVATTLTDDVMLSGLVPGKEYTVNGYMAVKEDSQEGIPMYLKEDGTTTENKDEAVSSELTFVAEEAEQSVTLEFDISQEAVAGKTLVAFETLSHNGVIITVHADINDEDQSVHYPDLHTNASNDDTTDDVGKVGKTSITDVVTFTNLLPDEEYTIVGHLVYKTDVLDKDGNVIHKAGEQLYSPGSEEQVLVKEAYDEEVVTGYECVCGETFETLEEHLAHADEKGIETTYSCVTCEEETGEAVTFETEEELLAHAEETGHETAIGTCDHSQYTEITETIHHEAEYETVTLDPAPYEETVILKAGEHEADGSVEVVFEIDSTAVMGYSLVAFEELWHNDVKVAVHADINDLDQTVDFPKIETDLHDKETGSKMAKADEDITLTDTVTYQNLVIGRKYTLEGTLMNQATEEPMLDDNGNEIHSEPVEFTATQKNGTMDIDFTFKGVSLAGETVVAFEYLYHNDVLVTSHTDIEDEAQTVHIPEIGTTAVFGNGLKLANGADKAILVDTVEFKNLIPNVEYIITTTLMNKETGKAITVNNEPIIVETSFTPKKANGTTEIKIPVPADAYYGAMVVFEEIMEVKTGCIVADHKDINDEAQTGRIPSVATTATFKDGSKSASLANEQVIIDTVAYKDLVPGTYALKGILMNKSTGEAVSSNGEAITTELEFEITSLKKNSGTETMEFTVPYRTVSGDTVVFEELYYVSEDGKTETLVGEHKDINDADQTVTFTYSPKTGDFPVAGFGIMAALAGGGIALAARKRKDGEAE